MKLDKDLQSIQEVRNLIDEAKKAATVLEQMSQEQLDKIVQAIALECEANAEYLAKMANQETGYGIWQDKVLKNLLGSTTTYQYIKDMKVKGIIKEDAAQGIIEIGIPLGIIAALIPSTNPTSTTMYKCLIALKAGNSIIISPHPAALNSITATVDIINQAAQKAGAPQGAICCIKTATAQATDALMKSKDIALILATGGEAMVRAAYSSGNPAIGVGPGNGPAFIDKTADIALAVSRIIESKIFDNGTICASEQSIITEEAIAAKVEAELIAQGGYFLSDEQSLQLGKFLLRANGTMNPQIVGKSVQYIADLAGLSIPQGIKVLLSRQTNAGKDNAYAREKLCPILAYFVEKDWQAACNRSIQILNIEGVGHTMTIHAEDKNIIREFALQKPVSRLLVNTSASVGGVGATTNLAPALTLGCGSVGGSATSDNVTPLNLINIRRVAWGIREMADLRAQSTNISPPPVKANDDAGISFTKEDIAMITEAVLARLNK